jgi:SnoaL-like domain
MKNKILLYIGLAVFLSACQFMQPKIEAAPPKPVDLDAAKKEATEMLDNYHGAMKAKNASEMSNLFAEDGLYCGSDPNEFWDKEAFADYIRKAFADTSVVINYTVERRKVRVSPDGKSAIAVEQFIDASSPRILMRVVSHLVKDSVKWKLDFTSWSLVPSNEDVPKINEAVANPQPKADGQ